MDFVGLGIWAGINFFGERAGIVVVFCRLKFDRHTVVDDHLELDGVRFVALIAIKIDDFNDDPFAGIDSH